jgi:hypothetical protein
MSSVCYNVIFNVVQKDKATYVEDELILTALRASGCKSSFETGGATEITFGVYHDGSVSELTDIVNQILATTDTGYTLKRVELWKSSL